MQFGLVKGLWSPWIQPVYLIAISAGVGGPQINVKIQHCSQKPKSETRSTSTAASGVAYKERLNMPVVAEVVAREQPEHLREYFMERVRYYREQSIQLPRASDPRYLEMASQNEKK